jgi:hypothetical protein
MSITDSGTFNWLVGSVLIDDTIETIDSPFLNLNQYNLTFNNEIPTIDLFNPIPSTSISLQSNSVIGNVILKDSIPQYKNSINLVKNNNNTTPRNKKRVLRIVGLQYIGTKRVFGINTSPSAGTEDLLIFIPYGYSIKIVTPGQGLIFWQQNLMTDSVTFESVEVVDYYRVNRLTNPNYPTQYWGNNVDLNTIQQHIYNQTINNQRFSIVFFTGKTLPGVDDILTSEIINGYSLNSPVIDINFVLEFYVDRADTAILPPISGNFVTQSLPLSNAIQTDLTYTSSIDKITREQEDNSDIIILPGWYKQNYPTLSINQLTLNNQYLVMCPPPFYLWTLNDLSFTVQERLNYLSNQIVLMDNVLNSITKTVVESLLLNNIALSALANNITIIDTKVQIALENITTVFTDLNNRVTAIETYINEQIEANQPSSFEENITSVTVGIAFAAFALYFAPTATGTAFTFGQTFGKSLFRGVDALGKGDKGGAIANFANAVMLGSIFAKNVALLNTDPNATIPPVEIDLANNPVLLENIILTQNNLNLRKVPLLEFNNKNDNLNNLEELYKALVGINDLAETNSNFNPYLNNITLDLINNNLIKRLLLTNLINKL